MKHDFYLIENMSILYYPKNDVISNFIMEALNESVYIKKNSGRN